MTDIIMKHFHFEGQIILPLKVMPFCTWLEGSVIAFLVRFDPLGNETSELIALSFRSKLLYSPSPFVERQWSPQFITLINPLHNCQEKQAWPLLLGKHLKKVSKSRWTRASFQTWVVMRQSFPHAITKNGFLLPYTYAPFWWKKIWVLVNYWKIRIFGRIALFQSLSSRGDFPWQSWIRIPFVRAVAQKRCNSYQGSVCRGNFTLSQ